MLCDVMVSNKTGLEEEESVVFLPCRVAIDLRLGIGLPVRGGGWLPLLCLPGV